MEAVIKTDGAFKSKCAREMYVLQPYTETKSIISIKTLESSDLLQFCIIFFSMNEMAHGCSTANSLFKNFCILIGS